VSARAAVATAAETARVQRHAATLIAGLAALLLVTGVLYARDAVLCQLGPGSATISSRSP
jgi:hypothetical protein